MNDKRFDAWRASNPARESLNPVAKEVARGVWRAAQRDLAAELWQSPLAFAEHTRERLTGDLPRGDEPDKENPC